VVVAAPENAPNVVRSPAASFEAMADKDVFAVIWDTVVILPNPDMVIVGKVSLSPAGAMEALAMKADFPVI